MEANDTLTTFICLFHSPERAESALNALESAGIQRNRITSTWNGDAKDAQVSAGELRRVGVPDRDLHRLEKGLAEGGVVLSLEAPEDRSDEVERIFHHYSADKIDDTETTPRASDAAPVAGSEPAGRSTGEGFVVPIVAEELVVGKRNVDRGGVRVFQRTVSEPVHEQMQLHNEHVVVERHAVDRAVTPADFETGQGTLELLETEEVAVVQKVARVVEEVHVSKQGSDRVEQINDTVRHTEISVEEFAPEESASPSSFRNDMDRKVRE